MSSASESVAMASDRSGVILTVNYVKMQLCNIINIVILKLEVQF